MTPSTKIGPGVTLHPSVTAVIERRCCYTLRDPELVYENNQIKLRTWDLFKRIFCCTCTQTQRDTRSSNHQESLNAFNRYLAAKFDPPIIAQAQALSVQLDKLDSFRVSHAQVVLQMATALKPRYEEIKRFIIWLNWHKVYQDTLNTMQDSDQPTLEDMSSGSLKDQQAYTPKNLLIQTKDGERAKLEFKAIHRIVKKLPLEGISGEEVTLIIDQTQSSFKRSAMTAIVPYLEVQQAVLRGIIAKKGKIKSPAALITETLKSEIEGYESIKELTPTQWIYLLARKQPYIPPQKQTAPSLTREMEEFNQHARDEHKTAHGVGRQGERRKSSHGSFFATNQDHDLGL